MNDSVVVQFHRLMKAIRESSEEGFISVISDYEAAELIAAALDVIQPDEIEARAAAIELASVFQDIARS